MVLCIFFFDFLQNHFWIPTVKFQVIAFNNSLFCNEIQTLGKNTVIQTAGNFPNVCVNVGENCTPLTSRIISIISNY